MKVYVIKIDPIYYQAIDYHRHPHWGKYRRELNPMKSFCSINKQPMDVPILTQTFGPHYFTSLLYLIPPPDGACGCVRYKGTAVQMRLDFSAWCVCVLSSHLFWTSDLWTHQPGPHRRKVTQDNSVVQRLGGWECHKFVSVLGGDGTKIASPGNIFDQPPSEFGASFPPM